MASVDEIWLVDFGDPYPGEPARRRPTVVIGPPQTFGPSFPFAIVVPMTTARRGLSLHVEVEPRPGTGLVETSYIQCELIRSVNRDRLVHPLGRLDAGTSSRVAEVIRALLSY
jgi:mRNA interferase MazF